MKNTLKVLVFIVAVCFGFIAAVCFGANTASSMKQGSLNDYEGVYLGLSPTDESAVMLGEMEITISGRDVKIRMATGTKIQEERMNVAEFVSMKAQEVKEIFKDGSEYPARTVGFKTKRGFPKLLFLKDPKEDEWGLIVRTGGMGEILGPTVLYSPVQVVRGDYEKIVRNIEKEAGKGVLPRLRNKGMAEKK